jgi:hypothetical protein
MQPTKILIIRHAEKPDTYNGLYYQGVGELGGCPADPDSLITLGWQRAGAIANMLAPFSGVFPSSFFAKPDIIYASDPANDSKRPYQTVLPLATKGIELVTSYPPKEYPQMVTSVLGYNNQSQESCTVLIAWQHEDILPKETGDDSIVKELLLQTNTHIGSLAIPVGPWPSERYDMVFVFERPSGTGPFVGFKQVPQMLLAGDKTNLFPTAVY